MHMSTYTYNILGERQMTLRKIFCTYQQIKYYFYQYF